MTYIPPVSGPVYPALPSVAKFRKAKAGGDTKAYGEAVHAAIRALQRASLARETPSHRCPCASGTYHSEAKDIHKAVNAQNRRDFEREAYKPRRTDAQVVAAYKVAMEEKRVRERSQARPHLSFAA